MSCTVACSVIAKPALAAVLPSSALLARTIFKWSPCSGLQRSWWDQAGRHRRPRWRLPTGDPTEAQDAHLPALQALLGRPFPEGGRAVVVRTAAAGAGEPLPAAVPRCCPGSEGCCSRACRRPWSMLCNAGLLDINTLLAKQAPQQCILASSIEG